MKNTKNYPPWEATDFSRSEFACKCNCGADDISPLLVQKIQKARDFLQSPIVITSGVRCEFHNSGVGGSPESSHLTGSAIDIKASTFEQVCRLLFALGNAGFNRGGVSVKDGFIHADIDLYKKQDSIWFY